MNYLAPGVYVKDAKNVSSSIEGASTSNGGMIGTALRGPVGVPVAVTSWTDYSTKFARGLASPYVASSDLAHAVQGFFLNGGSKLYVVRVAKGASKASVTSTSESEPVSISAVDEGEWGNRLKVKITTNADDMSLFDLNIELNGEIVQTFTGVSNDTKSDKHYSVVVSDEYIKVTTGNLVVEDLTLTGGTDGNTGVTDSDYINALNLFDSIDDISLIAIPGQTSEAITTALCDYCSGESHPYVFAIMDAPKNSTVESLKALRKKMSCDRGALYAPYIRVIDPTSSTGALRDCPVSGHVMGVYARIIADRGIHKAPAGEEAVIRGAVEVVTKFGEADSATLNPLGVNCIMPRANKGIVIWGARSLNSDLRYVSDILLKLYIKKSIYDGTQFAVFEPNDNLLRTRVVTACQDFLNTLWKDGSLNGASAEEAFSVVCNDELNPESSVKQGILNTSIGYNGKTPAEFVVFTVSHQNSN